jgi:hypothetical protein
MGTYISIDDDPNQVRGTGAMIRSLAESFGSKVKGVLAEINATDSTRPWGADTFGQVFDRESYNRVDSDSRPASEVVKGRLSDAGDLMSKVGGHVVRAMDEIQSADAEAGAAIKAVRL